MTPEAPQALSVDACPHAEQLAAYIDGGLSAEERAVVQRHLLTCPDCRDVVGALAATADVARQPALGNRIVPRTSRSTWLPVAAGVLAAAAIVVLAVRLYTPTEDPMKSLIDAVGPERTVEPRISGGFPHRPLAPLTRSAARSEPSPELRIAAAQLQERAARRTSENVHAYGVARLLLGDTDGAIRSLEEAVTLTPRDPRFLSDLGAAYLIQARLQNRRDDAERALRVIDSANALSVLPETLFNRALALELLGRNAEAIAAWDAYLARDHESGWANEAREHLARATR